MTEERTYLAWINYVFKESYSSLRYLVTSVALSLRGGWSSWGPVSVIVLGVSVVLPTSYMIYIRYRIWRADARVIYNRLYPWWFVRLLSPLIVYKGMNIATMMLKNILLARTFQVRSDDVFVCGFPRSGTNWTQEMVYLVINSADTDKANSERIDVRVPLLERWTTDLAKETRRPITDTRVYKTHLHYHLLPRDIETKRTKIIFVIRNPKDVTVSYYKFFTKLYIPMKKDFAVFVDNFVTGEVLLGPWSETVGGFWERRHQENVLILGYEDMLKDREGAVRKLASFLNKPLTDEQIQTIVRHCSFNSMKHNDKTNYNWHDASGFCKKMGNSFIRKGISGDWTNHLSPDQSARIDKMVEDAFGTELTFVEHT